MRQTIEKAFIEKCRDSFNEDNRNLLISNSVVKNGINDTSINHKTVTDMYYEFTDEIEVGKVTHQKQTGRCWMFAALNNIRYAISKELKLKDKNFELSQAFTMFWDKFEKANYFLESIIDSVDKNLVSRTVSWLLELPTNDGGQWDMFVALVEKYGIIPKYAMPESFHSSNSRQMNFILDLFLRNAAKKIREMYKEKKESSHIRSKKEEMLISFYSLLAYFLGEPPKKLDFEYRDKENVFHRVDNITPVEFYKQISPIKLTDYVSIINAPTADKPFGKTYTVKYLGNVMGPRQIHYLNLPISDLKDLSIRQLKDGHPVWFGCDVGKYMNRDLGILDNELYQYENLLNIDIDLTKAERLDYRGSVLTHAMVFTGVHIVEGSPKKWKVQNSWGEEVGKEGFFIMSDGWFDEYNYEIAVNKSYLNEEQLKMYEQKPVVLAPWDPMGSLASSR